jgi:hypothetical protein
MKLRYKKFGRLISVYHNGRCFVSTQMRPITINWACVGEVSIKQAVIFHRQFGRAIEFACQQEIKRQNIKRPQND